VVVAEVEDVERRGCRIERGVRAGLAVFGGGASIASTAFECNLIALDSELAGPVQSHLDDAGGNVCGCAGASIACTVQSSSLAPPAPVDDSPPAE
jgi:hypothetical protein